MGASVVGGGKGGGQCAKRGGKIAAQQLARNKQRDFQCDGVITPASDRRGKFSGQGVRLAGRRCACVEACRASASAVIEKAAQRSGTLFGAGNARVLFHQASGPLQFFPI